MYRRPGAENEWTHNSCAPSRRRDPRTPPTLPSSSPELAVASRTRETTLDTWFATQRSGSVGGRHREGEARCRPSSGRGPSAFLRRPGGPGFERGAAAAALQGPVHGSREKRRHLEPRDVGRRIVGRDRRPGRGPEGRRSPARRGRRRRRPRRRRGRRLQRGALSRRRRGIAAVKQTGMKSPTNGPGNRFQQGRPSLQPGRLIVKPGGGETPVRSARACWRCSARSRS